MIQCNIIQQTKFKVIVRLTPPIMVVLRPLAPPLPDTDSEGMGAEDGGDGDECITSLDSDAGRTPRTQPPESGTMMCWTGGGCEETGAKSCGSAWMDESASSLFWSYLMHVRVSETGARRWWSELMIAMIL